MGEAAAQPHAAAAKKSAKATARRPATLEEKRARQRAYVKKSYYRQQKTVHTLKQQVRELEAEYRRLESAVALPQDPANKTPHADHNNATREQDVLEDEQYLEELFAHEDAATTALTTTYAQLTLLKEELRRENRALTDAANEHDKFQYQLGLWVEAENDSHDTYASSSNSFRHSSRGRSKSGIHCPPPVLTRPFTVEECQKIASSCYAEVRAFLESNPSKSTGANVFGWRDERRMLEDGSCFTYSLKKFFHGRTAAELSLGGWRINSTSRLRDFYAKSIDMEVHVLQQVDADNVIMYRVIHSSDGQFIDKTFFLTTRLRTETGYVILFRSLETEERIVEYSESGSESPGAMDRDMNADVEREQERWVNLLTWHGAVELSGVAARDFARCAEMGKHGGWTRVCDLLNQSVRNMDPCAAKKVRGADMLPSSSRAVNNDLLQRLRHKKEPRTSHRSWERLPSVIRKRECIHTTRSMHRASTTEKGELALIHLALAEIGSVFIREHAARVITITLPVGYPYEAWIVLAD